MHVFLQVALVFLLIFSPIAYGSVTILPLTILESTSAVMVLFWLLVMLRKGEISFAKTGFIFPLLYFVIFAVFQLLPLPKELIGLLSGGTINLYKNLVPQRFLKDFLCLSIYPGAGITEAIKLLSFMGIFLLIINSKPTRKQLSFIINTIILLGLLISLFGIIKKFNYIGDIHWFKPPESDFSLSATFVNRNSFAGYINMVIPLALGYLFDNIGIAKKIIYAFIAGIMNLALFLSGSRGGMLLSILVVLFMFLLARFKNNHRKQIETGYIWYFLVFYFFLFCLEAKAILIRLATLFQKETFMVFGHGYSWLDILRIWRDFPIFGTGLGTFGSISCAYNSQTVQGYFRYAHNDYFQLLSETGIVGGVLMALFFILYFKSVISIWLKRSDIYIVCMVLGGISSISGMLFYSLFDFNLHVSANALLFFILMGLVYRMLFDYSPRKLDARDMSVITPEMD